MGVYENLISLGVYVISFDQIKMSATQTSRKPDRKVRHQVAGAVAIQLKEYSGLTTEGRISTPM
jgi:hypothetical protein